MREWTVLAQDPAILRRDGRAVTTRLWLPAERLEPGPVGHRIQVLDYDASSGRYVPPRAGDPTQDRYANITDIDRLVRSPDFHAQNVYAIAMATLLQFEAALGRQVPWAFVHGHQLKIAPHAFAEANAYYSREMEGLAFGYFPGQRGKPVFTCLSYDVIAHETTHALIDGLRSGFLRPSSPDQAAFHEGFADLVALLSVFTNPELVAELLTRGVLESGRTLISARALDPTSLRGSVLLTLATQMGQELSGIRGQALRASAELPVSSDYLGQRPYQEPHKRGEILVAAVMNAFLEVWVARLAPLRVTKGQPLNVKVVAEEGTTAAQQLLRVLIRALDYAPPIDLSFGDFLSAALTADVELYPDDSKYRYRQVLRNWCRDFGIHPTSRGYRGSGVWAPPPHAVSVQGMHAEPLRRDPDAMFRFVWENAAALGMKTEPYTRVTFVRPCVRIGKDQFTLRETVAEYVQTLQLKASELARRGIRKPKDMPRSQVVTLYGGGTLIFDDFGQLKYHIGKGVDSPKQTERLQSLWERGFFQDGGETADFAQLHRDRALQRIPPPQEHW